MEESNKYKALQHIEKSILELDKAISALMEEEDTDVIACIIQGGAEAAQGAIRCHMSLLRHEVSMEALK